MALADLESEDRELATDVPSGAVIDIATGPAERERLRDERHDGRDIVGRSAFRVLRASAEGRFGGGDRAPYVAAAVLNPHAFDEARRKLVVPGQPTHWQQWAALTSEPARTRLQHLAESATTTAA